MATPSLKKKIGAYCTSNGVVVPPGFGRNSPSRYAVVRLDGASPKLVAKTWFTQADLINYIQNTLVPEVGSELNGRIQILDFKDGRILGYTGSPKLSQLGDLPAESPRQQVE